MASHTDQLAGKVALVTGAASGIGLAVTQTFLAAGARVFGVDRSEENIASALSQLQSQGFESSSYVFHRADVADEESVIAFVDRCAKDLSGLDIVVLNAGIGAVKPIIQTTAQEYDNIMRVNARGRKCPILILRTSSRRRNKIDSS